MRSGTHGFGVGITTWIGVPSPTLHALVGGAFRVEPGRQEDRAALGVELEHLRRVGGQEEPVLGRPGAHGFRPALEDRDVERVDLGLEEHPRLAGRRTVGAGGELGHGRLDLELQALQRPVAALHDLRGDAGQGHDRADLLPLPAKENDVT